MSPTSSPTLLTTSNAALADETEAIQAIFSDETITVISASNTSTTIHLQPPSQPFTFLLTLPPTYPDLPPTINGTASTGNTEKGAGDAAVKLLASVLGNIYQPGAVCLFDLISDAGSLLAEQYGTKTEAATGHEESHRLDEKTTDAVAGEDPEHGHDLTHPQGSSTTYPLPKWTASAPLTVQKSTFIAHAAPCSSRDEARAHVAALLASSRKIAAATHNITAYRIRQADSASAAAVAGGGGNKNESFLQDCDDDGESAAGGRLLHLLQVMECEGVVVVVTRWYGGVKLGGERFRCIGNVAREALVEGAWGKKESGGGGNSSGQRRR